MMKCDSVHSDSAVSSSNPGRAMSFLCCCIHDFLVLSQLLFQFSHNVNALMQVKKGKNRTETTYLSPNKNLLLFFKTAASLCIAMIQCHRIEKSFLQNLNGLTYLYC